MAKLRGTKPQTKIYKLRNVDIEIYPVPFGVFKKIQDELELYAQDKDRQYKIICDFLANYTSLEPDDFGEADWCLTTKEAYELFLEAFDFGTNPKVNGPVGSSMSSNP